MNNRTIIDKLTSRKLWMALALFVSGLFAAFGMESTGEKIAGLILQGAAVIAYIVGEGLVDAANKPAPSGEESDPEIIYRECDENGIPLDGHYMLCYNNEEDDCEACKIGTSGLFHGAQGDE